MIRRGAAFLAVVLVIPSLALAATARCPGYGVTIRGSGTMPGGTTYWVRMDMRRVRAGGPGKYDGLWQVTRYDQGNIYRHFMRRTYTYTKRVNFTNNEWMICRSRVGGNRHVTSCTGGRFFLDVYRNRIGDKKKGRWLGTITGDRVRFRWGAAPYEPWQTGTISRVAGGQGDFSLTITTPKNGDRLAYGLGRPGKLKLTFIAKVAPQKYADKVKWTFPTIKGSKRRVTYPTGRRTFVRVTYTRLPPKNSSFGPQVVKARIETAGCRVSDQRRFYVFYPLTERNNPEGKYPNWFYYWRQTPAARPYGQPVRVEYGGTWFKACKQRIVPAVFHPGWAYKTLHVCDLSKANFRLDYPLINRYWVSKFKGFLTARYIDVFALAVIHEYVHQRCYHTWRAAQAIIDHDQDGIPDGIELGMKFSPQKFQTYFPQKLSKIGGDEEWLAYEEMGRYSLGQFKKYDWAAPGSQWP